MAILPILTYPNQRLLEVSKPVLEPMKISQQFIYDLTETMFSVGGMGLAAIQVGVPERIAVMKFTGNRAEVIVNPEIVITNGEPVELIESCLSIPSKTFKVKRWKSIRVRVTRPFDGRTILKNYHGIYAQCLLHELDHFLGKLINNDSNN